MHKYYKSGLLVSCQWYLNYLTVLSFSDLNAWVDRRRKETQSENQEYSKCWFFSTILYMLWRAKERKKWIWEKIDNYGAFRRMEKDSKNWWALCVEYRSVFGLRIFLVSWWCRSVFRGSSSKNKNFESKKHGEPLNMRKFEIWWFFTKSPNLVSLQFLSNMRNTLHKTKTKEEDTWQIHLG